MGPSNNFLIYTDISSVINFIMKQGVARLMTSKMQLIVIISILAVVMNICAGVHWESTLRKDNSTYYYWTIDRESSNISFDLESHVEGITSPVETSIRTLHPYQSYYAEIGSNDVNLHERTSSAEGRYRSIDEIKFNSKVNDNIDILVDKPVGSGIYTIEYENEIWPVFLKTSKSLDYYGRQINERDLEENNRDFVSTNLLYNNRLSFEKNSVLNLQRTNATVYVFNDTINEVLLRAQFKPTKSLKYDFNAATTGIADLKYAREDYQYTQFDANHKSYPTNIYSEERYFGEFRISRDINMRSQHNRLNNTINRQEYLDGLVTSWLPCCNNEWEDASYLDAMKSGTDAKEVFDCTCYGKARRN